MNAYCKGCANHHRAGHPKGSALEKSKYNDWCVRFSGKASRLVGHCKVMSGKKVASDQQPVVHHGEAFTDSEQAAKVNAGNLSNIPSKNTQDDE